MKKRIYILSITILLSSFTLASNITVSGNVSGTWSADTVFVENTINIISGSTLTISAGTAIEFLGLHNFYVGGRLIAEGDKNNRIVFTTNHPDSVWGGIQFEASETQLVSKLSFCTIERAQANSTVKEGGGIFAGAGSVLSLTNTILKNNRALSGAGLFISSSVESIDVINCLFINNSANLTPGEDEHNLGGAITINSTSKVRIINCTITENISAEIGGGVFISDDTDVEFINTILYGNVSAPSGGDQIALQSDSVDPNFYNCNIEGNSSEFAIILGGTFTGDYENCIDSDPLFISNGDYHLGENSPCIDTGLDTTDVPTIDLDGADRPFNNDFDMGVYEFGAETSLPVCLSYFSAEYEGESINLQWATHSEVENLGFILERRAKEANWHYLSDYNSSSQLEGQGSSTQYSNYEYKDFNIIPGCSYEYRLSDVSYDGVITVHSIQSVTIPQKELIQAQSVVLYQNYPNPFNPITHIRYELSEPGNVLLEIFNLRGEKIKTLVNGYKLSGNYIQQWDASRYASGSYIYKLTVGNTIQYHRCNLIK